MRPAVTLLVVLLSAAAPPASSLAQSARVTGGSRESVHDVQRDAGSTRKPRVAVGEFVNRSGVERFAGGKHVGAGMKEMMVSALMESGAFLVFEDAGAVDFVIAGAVTELQQDRAGGGGGARGKRRGKKGFSIDLAELAAGFKRDCVAIDVRLVDVRTGQIVATTSVEGNADDFDLDGALGDVGKLLLQGGGHVATPLQQAVRNCIVTAVDWIAERVRAEELRVAAAEPKAAEPTEESGPPEPASGLPVAGPAPARPDRAAAAATPARTRTVEAPVALVLAEPRADAAVVALVGAGDELREGPPGPDANWIAVRLAGGAGGWIAAAALVH